MTTSPSPDPRLIATGNNVRSYAQSWGRRVRHGQLGVLPVVLGLIVIAVVFQTANPNFLTPLNLTNLTLQVAATGTISVGIFLVLLLGEVDLSVGSISGVCAAVLGVLVVNQGFGTAAAILTAVAVGIAIGLFQSLFIARLGVPAFVVTLAGLIAWQGLQLYILGGQGTINLPTGGITELTSTFLSPAVWWSLVAAIIVINLAVQLNERRQRRNAGLPARSLVQIALRQTLLISILAAAGIVLSQDRGVPLALVIFTGFVVIVGIVMTRTRYGQSVYAVGGNSEAARRAGMKVQLIRTSVFVIAGMFAAIGGILAASRLFAVSQSSGSGDVLLNAIAAVVIGGTSLFGGRGTAYSALLGTLVIGSISNGMDLLGLNSSIKLMITGGVLLAAVTLDTLARRGRQA
ncbi:ABC transporter permease [Acrocarpospora macrocephala]|uniref:Xylose transport system permease protein XylH n=1 Tax=Acrocarpospora macrocephala TaxID=150177 RepID=A0A5M3WEH6_9ACTN|nr:sugar ABC transporter permease [Acrocarpospora macrocephala]GES06492.1 ABC transporter permease [Acrocarpospora macrocephala]